MASNIQYQDPSLVFPTAAAAAENNNGFLQQANNFYNTTQQAAQTAMKGPAGMAMMRGGERVAGAAQRVHADTEPRVVGIENTAKQGGLIAGEDAAALDSIPTDTIKI